MGIRNKKSTIEVHNSLLDGVDSTKQIPTFILDLHSLPAHEVDTVVDCVEMIQTLSPTFRIVAMGDRSIFRSTAALGWPFEHLMPPEHASRLNERAQFEVYRQERIRIASAHYSNPQVIRESSHMQYASTIGNLIGRRDIVNIALELLNTASPSTNTYANIESAINELSEKSKVHIAGAEGSALITTDYLDSSSYFLFGGDPDSCSLEEIRNNYSIPDDVAILRTSFDPSSTLRFESFLYAELARHLRSDLIVLMPARLSATLAYDVLQWVDLATAPSQFPIKIVEEYAEGYRLLSDSNLLDWDLAGRYSIARRVSRNFSRE